MCVAREVIRVRGLNWTSETGENLTGHKKKKKMKNTKERLVNLPLRLIRNWVRVLVLYHCGMVKSIKMDQSEEKARAEAFDVFLFSNRFFYGYIALAPFATKKSKCHL